MVRLLLGMEGLPLLVPRGPGLQVGQDLRDGQLRAHRFSSHRRDVPVPRGTISSVCHDVEARRGIGRAGRSKWISRREDTTTECGNVPVRSIPESIRCGIRSFPSSEWRGRRLACPARRQGKSGGSSSHCGRQRIERCNVPTICHDENVMCSDVQALRPAGRVRCGKERSRRETESVRCGDGPATRGIRWGCHGKWRVMCIEESV